MNNGEEIRKYLGEVWKQRSGKGQGTRHLAVQLGLLGHFFAYEPAALPPTKLELAPLCLCGKDKADTLCLAFLYIASSRW